jgi:diaminopimelate decarboxylase
MNAFEFKRGELYCEGVPLRRLAERFGTPLYVYSRNHIVSQHRALDRAFRGVDHLLCYAVKANSNLAVIRVLAEAGSGFDIVSGGELYRVVQAGGDPRRCVFSGVGKTRDEIEYALRLGIYCFNVESESELKLIDAVGRRLRKRAPIAIRVNPGVDPETHHYISTGKHESKFGISIKDAAAIYRQAYRLRGIEVRGVQMHIGSQITKTTPFELAIRKMMPLVERLPEIQAFDIGGGLGIRYRNETPPPAKQYAAAVLPHLSQLGLRIITEHGRFVVGNAGALVTRVMNVKRTPVKTFVITDAAMNDLIRPALYGSYHEIVPVQGRRQGRLRHQKVDVVGPVCESGDFFAQDRQMPTVDEGELLAVMSAGAYGMTMASNYNTRPRPAEVMVAGRHVELVRRRETLKDLIRAEVYPAPSGV